VTKNSNTSTRSRARVAALAAGLLLLCAPAVAACGSSSNTTSETTTSTTSASLPTTTRTISPAVAAAYRATLSAYAACMRSHGVLVAPPHTARNGEPVLSAPVGTRQQIFAALPKCKSQANAALQAHQNLITGG
jgi:hypothetical protein